MHFNILEHLLCVRRYSRHWRNFNNQVDKVLPSRGSYSSGGSRQAQNKKVKGTDDKYEVKENLQERYGMWGGDRVSASSEKGQAGGCKKQHRLAHSSVNPPHRTQR